MNCFPTQGQTLLLKACTTVSRNDATDFFEQWKSHIDIDLEGASSRELGLPQVYDKLDFGSQRLLSLLYYQLTSHGLNDTSITKLKGYFKYVWVKNQLIAKDEKLISEALQAIDIPVIAFKGIRVAEYYPHLGTRPTADLDIVIRQENLEKAEPILLKMGWRIKNFPTRITEMTELLSHAITLKKENHELDLHKRFSQFLFKPKTRELFWKSVIKNNEGLLHLAPAHELFCAILHGMVYSPIPGIRWVTDVVFITRSFNKNDWEEFLHISQTEDYGKLIKRALDYLVDEGFITIPDYLDFTFMRSISAKKDSPYIDLLTRERAENDFSMFKRHYLTATQISDSLLSRWKLLVKHYKATWNLQSNKDLIAHAAKVFVGKVVSLLKK